MEPALTPARIELDLRLSGKPVEGYVAASGEEPRRFIGYAGLIAALEAIRAANGPKPEEARDGATSPTTT